MAIITKEIKDKLKEVMADPVAKALLQEKCRWEHMSLSAVLREWGDPREWNVYKKGRK